MKLRYNKPHFHVNDEGFMVACYHKAKSNYLGFLIGTTLSFPIEHFLYEKVWPFNLLTKWIGL